MRRTWLLPIAVGAIAGAMTFASAASLTVTSKDLTVLSVTATPPPTGDTTVPFPVSLTSASGTATGSGGSGRANENDTITITFSERLDASSICSLWAQDPSGIVNSTTTVTLVNAFAGTNDGITFATTCGSGGTLAIGSIKLGHSGYTTSGNFTFTGSTIEWDPQNLTLVVTLGTRSSGNPPLVPAATESHIYTPASSIKDLAGNGIAGTATDTDERFF